MSRFCIRRFPTHEILSRCRPMHVFLFDARFQHCATAYRFENRESRSRGNHGDSGRQARFDPSYDARNRDRNLNLDHRFNPGTASFSTKLQSTWVDFKSTPWRETSLGGSEILFDRDRGRANHVYTNPLILRSGCCASLQIPLARNSRYCWRVLRRQEISLVC